MQEALCSRILDSNKGLLIVTNYQAPTSFVVVKASCFSDIKW